MSFFARIKNKNKSEHSYSRELLPKLPPHEDTCYLLEFVSDTSEHCKQMEPIVSQLEKDLNTKFRRVNLSKRGEFANLYDCVGGNECGTVPFFYNRRTAQAVCGRTSYQNLECLAMGRPGHVFVEDEEEEIKNETEPRRSDSSFMDFINEKFFSGSKQ